MTDSGLQQAFAALRRALATEIIGQPALVDQLLVALLSDGHLLVEGAPGLAKTRALKTLAALLKADAQRIQFTPDLLPSDITGSEIYRPETGSFEFLSGPVFNHLVLADEINRAPAKVQSALLEAMAERQVSVAGRTLPLPALFMVMATQNPIEQEGTYPLPEAQLDRFIMQVSVDYPDADSEAAILELARAEVTGDKALLPDAQLAIDQVLAARAEVMQLHMSEAVQQYLIQFVLATRDPARYDKALANTVDYGASPRGTIALDRCARAHAWLLGRNYVTPEDVQSMVHNCLGHRIILNLNAEMQGLNRPGLLNALLDLVPAV